MVENDYYTFVGDHVSDKYIVDNFFQYIENRVSDIVKKFEKKQRLTVDEFNWLPTFIASVFIRSPQFADRIKKHLFQAQNEDKDSSEKPKNNNPEFSDKVVKDTILSMRFGFLKEIDFALRDMSWTILRCKKGSSFITTDNPFTIIGPPGRNPDDMSIMLPGSLLAIPISQSCCIQISSIGHGVRELFLTNEKVKFLNREIAMNSTRFIVARDKELLESIVKFCKKYNWEKAFETKNPAN